MGDIIDIVNYEREIEISGRKLKIRQLKIKELFAYFRSKIKDRRIADAQQMANGLNKDLALSFLYDIWEKLPQGSALTEAAADLYTSVEGIIDAIYLAARDLNKITREEIEELIDIKQLGKLDPIIAWISGIKITDKDKSEDKSEDNKNGDEIKKK